MKATAQTPRVMPRAERTMAPVPAAATSHPTPKLRPRLVDVSKVAANELAPSPATVGAGPPRVVAVAAGAAAKAPAPAAAAAAAKTPASAPARIPAPTVAPAGAAIPVAGPAPVPAGSVSQFIDLEVEARRCADLDALRYAIVNSTRKLGQFDQAFLAEPGLGGAWTVTRASSVATIDRNSAAVRLLTAWIARPDDAGRVGAPEPRLANLAEETRVAVGTFAFPHALWLPIKARDGRMLGALIALKSESWRPQHSALLLPLADAYGHAWDALAPRSAAPAARIRGYVSRSRIALAAAVLALLAAFIPVPMSALAPAEVTAAEPMLATAPIDGVIADILVAPGGWVEKGKPIIRFVDVKLRNDVEVARRNKAVAQARHFKVVQSSVATQKDMQELATTKAEFDVAAAELQFAEDMLARSVIKADRSGLLIYSAKSDWLGKPVSTGERLMEIGDPASTEIKIDLPVSDSIAIGTGSRVSLFLDGSPLSAIEGYVHRTSYRPTPTADQQMAFRVFARFKDAQPRRIGLHGVARVDSGEVALWFYLLRRPISALRQRIGL